MPSQRPRLLARRPSRSPSTRRPCATPWPRSAFAGAAGQARGAGARLRPRIRAPWPPGLAQLAAGLRSSSTPGRSAERRRPTSRIPTSRRPPSRATRCWPWAAPSSRQDPDAAAAAYLAAAEAGPGRPASAAPPSCAPPRPGTKASRPRRPSPRSSARSPPVRAGAAGAAAAGPRCRTAGARREAAAAAYDRLDRDYPASPEATRRRASPDGPGRRSFPPRPPTRSRARADPARRGAARGGQNAAPRSPPSAPPSRRRPTGDELDVVRVRLGSALIGREPRPRSRDPARRDRQRLRRRRREAAYLPRPPARAARRASAPTRRWSSASRARPGARRRCSSSRTTSRRMPATPRRCPTTAACSRTARTAATSSARPGAWASSTIRAGRYEEAAHACSRARPGAASRRARPPGFLYWAGRARAALGQVERARALYDETVRRFKHTYHGLRAARGAGPASASPRERGAAGRAARAAAPRTDVPEPQRTRVRQLLLIDRLDEAADELRALARDHAWARPPSPGSSGAAAACAPRSSP